MDHDAYNAYMRDYKREQYARLRAVMVESLGGQCVRCGATENLHFDHIDPASKSFDISQIQSHPWVHVVEELSKCQLLCQSHHQEKTLAERGQRSARGTHGTVAAYRYCGPPKCEECRKAKRDTPSYRARLG